MGIFLGWSIILIIEAMISFLQKRRFNISIWKIVTVLPLLLLTVVWSKDAIIAFANQAEATEVQIKRGPLSLPFITVCPYTQFASWMDLHFPCGQSESEFLHAVQKCLPSEPGLVDTILEEFLDQSLKYGPKSLVLVTKKESFIMENKDITTVFHNVFGPCYTYNTHGWQDKILECSHNYSSEACSNWKLEIHYPHVSGIIYKIFVHNQNDFPEVSFIHPNFNMHTGDTWLIEVVLRKKVSVKQPTRSNPCQQYWPKTCHEIQRQEKIATEYNCEVPFFFTGNHLMSQGQHPSCSNEVTTYGI